MDTFIEMLRFFKLKFPPDVDSSTGDICVFLGVIFGVISGREYIVGH